MKRTLIPISLVAVLLMLAAPKATRADTATLSVTPVAGPISVGDTFNVEVDIAGASELFAHQFDLDYNASLLSFDSVVEGAFLPDAGTTFFFAIDNGGGSVTVIDSLIGPLTGANGDGSLALFSFTALAGGTSPLNLANITLVSSNTNSSANNGSVTVGTPGVPEPGTLSLLVSAILSLAAFAWFKRA